MFETGKIATAAADDSPAAGDVVATLEQAFRAENRAAAQKVLAATDLSRQRFLSELDRLGNVDRAARAADAEVSVRLSCSRTVAQHFVDVGEMLLTSLPVVRAAFEAGEIDYSRVRALVDTLCGVPDEAIATVEKDVLACAMSLPPRALATEVERLLLARFPELAEQFAKEAAEERWVRCRPTIRGSARLEALLTAVEGREADGLIDEVAASVCPDDPRGVDQRRADAFMALMHGEQHLTCRCGSVGCPTTSAPLPARRRPLIQIVFDVTTLLGLSAEPPVLAGHGPIDPETARTLAEDATWQAILAEMHAATGVPEPPAMGRKRRAGAVPPATAEAAQPSTRADSYGEAVERATASLAAGPDLVNGRYPDGHGGYDRPPPGALTYRPSADLAALVRANDGTCRFPGCSVPAARCEIDHVVPYDYGDPQRGGWTVAGNLQCLCKGDHQRKTHRQWNAAMLDKRAIVWTDRTGLRAVTAPRGFRTTVCLPTGRGEPSPQPDATTPTAPRPHWDNRAPTAEERRDLLLEPTWWERHMGDDAPPPTLEQIADHPDGDMRRLGYELRRRHREHHAITQQRRRLSQSPPRGSVRPPPAPPDCTSARDSRRRNAR